MGLLITPITHHAASRVYTSDLDAFAAPTLLAVVVESAFACYGRVGYIGLRMGYVWQCLTLGRLRMLSSAPRLRE